MKNEANIQDAVDVHAPVVTIDEGEWLGDAVRLMRRRNVKHLLVTRHQGPDVEKAVAGVLSDRDIFARGMPGDGLALDYGLKVRDVMVTLPRCVDEDMSLGDALAMMWHYGASVLPVVDETGETRLVSESAFTRVLARACEEREPLDQATARGSVMMASPLMQSTMNLLAEMGI